MPSIEIFVCLKQVWRADVGMRLEIGEGGLNAAGWNIGGGLRETNPADQSALQVAISLREEAFEGQARVVALTLGPESEEDTLREALAGGADEVFRIWGSGWPVWAESGIDGSAGRTHWAARHVANAIASRKPFLVLTGDKSEDGGHECFGAFLAKEMGAAFAHRVTQVSSYEDGWRVVVRVERGYGQEITLPQPVVMTVSPLPRRLPYALLPAWLSSRAAEIPVLKAEGPPPPENQSEIRLPVPRVKRYSVPDAGLSARERIDSLVNTESSGSGRILADAPPETQAGETVALLRERGFIGVT